MSLYRIELFMLLSVGCVVSVKACWHVDQRQFLTEHLCVLVSAFSPMHRRWSSGKRHARFDGIIWPLLSGLTVSWFQFSPLYYLPTILKGNGHRSGPPHSNMSLQFLFLFCLPVVLFLIGRPRFLSECKLDRWEFDYFLVNLTESILGHISPLNPKQKIIFCKENEPHDIISMVIKACFTPRFSLQAMHANRLLWIFFFYYEN